MHSPNPTSDEGACENGERNMFGHNDGCTSLLNFHRRQC